MAIGGLVLAGAAGIALLVFAVQILIRAFKTRTAWGLVSLFVPLGALVFVFKHWDQTRRPFLRAMACVPLWMGGVALMALGGGAAVTLTPLGAETDTPASGTTVETPTLVLKTAALTESIADPGTLTPEECDDARIGRVAIAPKHVYMCGRQADAFGETRTEWINQVRDDSYFGDPLGGQWVSWLHLARKGTGEHVAFVVFDVLSSRDGRLSVECDAGGGKRLQASQARPQPGFMDECGYVSEQLGQGRFLFNWDKERPRVRFQTTEGPVIDVNLIKVS